MALSKAETWDSATPPSLPLGWNAHSLAVVTSTTFPYSNPNALTLSTSSSGAPFLATWGTGDASGSSSFSNTQSAYCSFTAGSSNGWEQGITFRGSISNLDNTSTSFYFACLKQNVSSGDGILYFGKIISGTRSNIASVTLASGNWTSSAWYQLLLTMTGDGSSTNTINLQVIRVSDGYYLDSGGNFGSSGTYAITSNDTSILTGQYYGTIQYAPAAGGMWLDNWTINATAGGGGGGGSLLRVTLDGLRKHSNLSGGMTG